MSTTLERMEATESILRCALNCYRLGWLDDCLWYLGATVGELENQMDAVRREALEAKTK